MTMTTLREFLEEISGMESHHWKQEALDILAPIIRAEKLAKCHKGDHSWNTETGYCDVCEIQREVFLQELLSEEKAANAERRRKMETREAQRYSQRDLFSELPYPLGKTMLSSMTTMTAPSTVAVPILEEYNSRRGWD